MYTLLIMESKHLEKEIARTSENEADSSGRKMTNLWQSHEFDLVGRAKEMYCTSGTSLATLEIKT